uniref:Latent transforming growth factor beta binding protein 2 n=1 Tax=Erpetoichthys calabaricus TaxID=27687 RepID=A0A8C4RE87_ERPCA
MACSCHTCSHVFCCSVLHSTTVCSQGAALGGLAVAIGFSGFALRDLSIFSPFLPLKLASEKIKQLFSVLFFSFSDNNECLEEGACLGSHCVNTVGSYYCTCQPPQIYDPIRRVCVSNTSQSDENLSICWVELGENLECRRILMERQTTFTECCCLYGEAWSLECALCPDRNSEDPSYESLAPETGPVLVDPVYEPGGRQSSRTGFGSRSSQSAGPPVVPIEPQPGEPWLQYRPRERVPYQEYPGQPLRRTRTEYEGYEGLSADECGILHGCENGRCIRVPEGYTCDCYDGYQLEMTTMACIDINECDEADDPATLCMNGQCVNTDGSYRCVCLRGFIMSLQPNYCIPALPQE